MSALMPVPGPVPRRSGARYGLQELRRIWERLSMYLPLLLMALLALGTYWLVRNTPLAPVAEPARAARHEVDYFMRRVTVKTFDDAGRLKSELFGTEARHFADTETLEIDQVRMRAVNPQGLLTTATANRALSNDAGNEVQLIGNALVIRETQQQADGSWRMTDLAWGAETWLAVRLHLSPGSEGTTRDLLAASVSGTALDGKQMQAHAPVLQLPVLDAAALQALPRNETAYSRLEELAFAKASEQLRQMAKDGDRLHRAPQTTRSP